MRASLQGHITTMQELADINPEGFLDEKGKDNLREVGPDTRKLQARAKLITTKDAKPYLRAPVSLPVTERELFFDIEVDPMRDVCYLHGL